VAPALVALPRGMGLSVAFAWQDVPFPPRSRYLLLRSEDHAVVKGRVPLRLIASTPIGTVYENAAASP
jgi:hypothetical protein